MNRVWMVKSVDGLVDYFTSAKKAYEHCEFWIKLRDDQIVSNFSDNLKDIKKYNFGRIAGNKEKNYFRIDSSPVR